VPETASRHVCSYPVQPFADDGTRNDRGRCQVPGCEVPAGLTVPVDEALLRSALRDALAFAQMQANLGDEEAPQFVAEYETALLQLADAPAVPEPRTEWGVAYEGEERPGVLFGVREGKCREDAEAMIAQGFADVLVTRTVAATPWQRVAEVKTGG
jgi:hypothetical protein